MDRNISELENIIDAAFEWKTQQWQVLSEQAIHTHHSKTVFFYETLSLYSKEKEIKKIIGKDKKREDLFGIKAIFIISAIIFGVQLILSHVFNYKEKDNFFENILIFNFLYLLASSWVREIIYKTEISSTENLMYLLERDMLACGLSRQFIQKIILHNEIFNDDKQDEYEALPAEEKNKISLKGHLKDFCISAAIITTFCNDDKLLEPPRDIQYGGTFF